MDNLTLSDAARLAGLPESNARYYKNKFIEFFPTVGEGKEIRYRPETVDLLRCIAEGFQNKQTATQIKKQLSLEFPINVEITEDTQQNDTTTQQQLITPGQTAALFFSVMVSQADTMKKLSEVMENQVKKDQELEQIKQELEKLKKQKRGFLSWILGRN